MTPMTAGQLTQYYASLLVIQYAGKPKASQTVALVTTGVVMPQTADLGSTVYVNQPTLPWLVQNGYNLNPTVQTVSLSAVPVSGSLSLTYDGSTSSVIPWNTTPAGLNSLSSTFFGTGEVQVTGTLLTQTLTLSFTTTTAPLLVGYSNDTLLDIHGSAVAVSTSTNQAQGLQLDVLGKYAGVTRSGFGTYGPVTLTDQDFLRLIQFAIATNNNGSSLSDIVKLLYQYFPGQVSVFDDSDTEPMQMTYYLASTAFSNDLLQLVVSEGLLPRPMAVGIAVLAPPSVTELYGWCDYRTATPTMPNTVHTVGMNCAAAYGSSDYVLTWPYLDYRQSLLG